MRWNATPSEITAMRKRVATRIGTKAFERWAPSEVIGMLEEALRELDDRQRAHDESLKRSVEGFKRAKEEALKRGDVATRRLNLARQKGVDERGHKLPPLATLREIEEQERRHAQGLQRGAQHLAIRKGIADLLRRLLTDNRMRTVWEALAIAGSAKDGKYQGHITYSYLFAGVARAAWMGPCEEEGWSPGVRKAWLLEVAELTEKLAQKLERTGADDFLWRRYLAEKYRWDLRQATEADRASAALPDSSREFTWDAGTVSELLRTLGRSAEKFLAPSLLGRPNDMHAKRVYFVRKMGKWCLHMFHAGREDLITPTAAVALNDDTLGQRQTYRLIQEMVGADAKLQKKPRKRH